MDLGNSIESGKSTLVDAQISLLDFKYRTGGIINGFGQFNFIVILHSIFRNAA